MKTFTEFIDNNNVAPSAEKTFPTFEEATTQGKDVADEKGSCVSDKMKDMIKEMCESGMSEMKSCHEDETPMTAENWMSECDSYMKECMESLKECCDTCMNA